MATTTNYPLPAFHYNVDIDGLPSMRFSEVSGLSIERQVITYKDGLSATKGSIHMPGLASEAKLSLKKGIMKADSALYDWINSIQVTQVTKRTVMISLLDDSGEKPLVTWKVLGAFPTKLDAPAFNATSNEVALESLDLIADSVSIDYQS